MRAKNWFAGCHTVAEVKKRYHKLAFAHHPDINHYPGATEDMQEINAAYHAALKGMDQQTTTGADKRQHTYHYNADIEQAIIDKINALLALRMTRVEIELIGTWVWINGDTKPHKEDLKALKCSWHSKRHCWYWHNGKRRRRSYSKKGFSHLRNLYGSKIFDGEEQPAAA